MPALTAQHLRKAFGPQVVLEDASFTLGRGERVALIGANGAGKSTLARILAGIESPDGGTVSVRRGLTVQYLAQEPVLDGDATARSAVEDALVAWRTATERHAQVTAQLAEAPAKKHDALLAEQAELDDAVAHLGGWDRGHEALSFLEKLGVQDVERPCRLRSGGERRRIALAQLLVASPDVAILDEPTNHLDADTVEWLERHLAESFRGAVLLVTHDRYFLDTIAQRIVELERGVLTSFPGGYGDYLESRATLLEHEQRVEQNRQNVLRREREWLSRGPKARGTKQKARIQRALELEARGPATAGRPGSVSLATAAAPRQGKTIVELRGLSLAPVPEAPPLHAPFDLILTAGERIGIVGPNGVGKTTLLRAVVAACEGDVGGPAATSGSIVVGKNVRASYLDQTRIRLDDDKSIFDDVRGDGSTVVSLGIRGRESMDLRSYLEMFLFDRHKQRQKVGSLSGGERARVALAKVLRQEANLLLFDEPTNDLDLPTLSVLEEMLVAYEGSVLVVTHDRAFLDRVATTILAFEPRENAPAVITRYAGGFEDYVIQRGRRAAAAAQESGARSGDASSSRAAGADAPSSRAGGAASPTDRPAAVASTPPRSKSGLTYAERLELEGIVDRVDAAEKDVAAVEALLADPALYATRGPEVAALRARLEAARAHAAALGARWEALESKKSS